jgi:hypothetical protein
VTTDENIGPQPELYVGSNPALCNISITLKGQGGEKTIQLTGTGSLFTLTGYNNTNKITLVLEDITLKGHGSNNAALVTVNHDAVFVMKSGAKIIGNTTSGTGGGVYFSGTSFTMDSGAIISGNTASADGGGVRLEAGTFTMSGGAKITGNATSGHGGGVYFNASFTMSGGEISGNTASGNGGGVYFSSSYGLSFTMGVGKISGNTANGSGGGVYFNTSYNGNFTMSGGEISGNTASSGNGGGVYFSGSNAGTFTMSGGEISDNKAVTGGGVYVTSSFNKTGGTIFGDNNNLHDGSNGSTENTATSGDGHVAKMSNGIMTRNSTAGTSQNMSSNTPGSAGGWEQ